MNVGGPCRSQCHPAVGGHVEMVYRFLSGSSAVEVVENQIVIDGRTAATQATRHVSGTQQADSRKHLRRMHAREVVARNVHVTVHSFTPSRCAVEHLAW